MVSGSLVPNTDFHQVERAKCPRRKHDARLDVRAIEEKLRRMEAEHGRSTREMLKSAAAAEQAIHEALLARTEIVEGNLSLVVLTATKYVRPGWTTIELVQVGNRGLMAAVEHFQYRAGRRFSPFAERKIRRAMTQAIARSTGGPRHGAR